MKRVSSNAITITMVLEGTNNFCLGLNTFKYIFCDIIYGAIYIFCSQALPLPYSLNDDGCRNYETGVFQ